MNPEFRRNLWLEFSTERLLVIPAVVVLALIAISGTLGRPAAVTFATYGAIAIAIVIVYCLINGLVLFGWQRWASGTWTVPAGTHAIANVLAVVLR